MHEAGKEVSREVAPEESRSTKRVPRANKSRRQQQKKNSASDIRALPLKIYYKASENVSNNNLKQDPDQNGLIIYGLLI